MKAKPKILIFIDWYLPAYKAGGPVRSVANFVARFQQQFQFFIICSDRDLGEGAAFKNIKPNEWMIGEKGEHVFYVSPSNQRYSFIKKLVSNMLFDKAYINGIFSVKFSVIPMMILRNYKQKTIVAPRGMLHSSALKVKPFKKKVFLGLLKVFGFLKSFTFQAMDNIEQNEIKKNLGQKYNILLAPNLSSKPITRLIENTKKTNSLSLFCLSRISPEKNIDYAIDILSKCSFSVVFDIYGEAINMDYFNLIKEKIKNLPAHITINLKGVVNPSEIPSVCPQYDAFFLPTKGENFGHAIYESFANGCPVIISNQTPWKKLAIKGVGFDLDLNKPNDFIDELNNFYLMDDVKYQRMRENSHKLAISIFENKAVEKLYLELFA